MDFGHGGAGEVDGVHQLEERCRQRSEPEEEELGLGLGLGFSVGAWESLLPSRTTEAASEAAFSLASSCNAIPTSATAIDGASLMPSPTFRDGNGQRN